MSLSLAWRNLWRNRRRTLITVASITFAVVLATFSKSINEGSYDQMIGNMVRFHTGYIQLQDPLFEEEPSLDNAIPYDESFGDAVLETDPRIGYVVPRIETFALAVGEEQTRGALVLGVDPEMEQRLNELSDRIVEGRMFEPGDGSAIFSEGLARRLNLAVGDTAVLLGQGRFGMTAAGKFEVAGIVKHPLKEMNDQMVYLSILDAQWLLSMDGHITSLIVMPDLVRNTDAVEQSLSSRFAGEDLRVLTWPEMMPELLQGIEFDRVTGFLMTGILYLVIAFGIFGTVLTMTLERQREFGVLLSIGMQRVQLGMVILIEILLICLLGIMAGVGLGFPLIYYFNRYPIEFTGEIAIMMEDMGMEPTLPTSLDPSIPAMQGVIVFVLAFFIFLYPITRIARLNIMEAARS